MVTRNFSAQVIGIPKQHMTVDGNAMNSVVAYQPAQKLYQEVVASHSKGCEHFMGMRETENWIIPCFIITNGCS